METCPQKISVLPDLNFGSSPTLIQQVITKLSLVSQLSFRVAVKRQVQTYCQVRHGIVSQGQEDLHRAM